MSKAFTQPTRWARTFVVSLSMLLLLGAAATSLGRDDIPELPAPDGSSDTPEMLIPMIDKSTLKLSSLRGKVVLLDFFLSTCPHCRDHAPHMVEIYQQYGKSGLVILGLAADPQDKAESVKAFIKEFKLSYPVGFVTTEVIAYYTDSHNHGVPQMVLFGPDGKMARRMVGWEEQTGKELLQAVQTQLQKLQTVKPGSKSSGKPNRRRALFA
jgi:thiol-disulfide isomerase/thioredoxin